MLNKLAKLKYLANNFEIIENCNGWNIKEDYVFFNEFDESNINS